MAEDPFAQVPEAGQATTLQMSNAPPAPTPAPAQQGAQGGDEFANLPDAFANLPEAGKTKTPATSMLGRFFEGAGNVPAAELPSQIATRLPGNLIGLAKSGVSLAAGLGDVINHYDSTDVENRPIPQFAHITRRALDWAQPRTEAEKEGFLAGNMGQMLALPTEAIFEGIPAIGRIGEAYKAMKEMGGDSLLARLARVGLSVIGDATSLGTRGAIEQGGQTALQTGGNLPATRQAAGQGLLWGGVLGGAGGALTGSAREAASYINAARAGTRDIAGATFETLPRTEDLMLRNVEQLKAEDVRDPATVAADEALGNIGKTGVRESLLRAAQERAPEIHPLPPSRQLPGGGGFVVGAAPGAETTPIREGQQIAYDPRKRQIGTRVVEGKGPGRFDLPQYSPVLGGGAIERGEIPGVSPLPTGPPGRPAHREPVWQYQTEVRPGQPTPTGQQLTGPPAVIFTDSGDGLSVMRARSELARYERILSDSDLVAEIGPRDTQQIESARQDLAEQLRRYDDYAASQPHFPQPDILDAVRNTGSIGEGGQQLTDYYGQFWQKANQAAEEAGDRTFTDLREEEKNIRARLNKSTARYDELKAELKANQQAQFDFFNKYRTTVSPQEWETFRKGYQDGIVLKNLDDFIQRKFGGITRAKEARGVGQRIFQPGENWNQELEDFYNDGFRDSETNRAVLERTIGQEHMDNLDRMGILFNSAERMEQTASLRDSIGMSIRRHYSGIRSVFAEATHMGGMAGGAGAGFILGTHVAGHVGAGIGGMIGGPAGYITAPWISGTITGTRRYVVDKLASDPDFLRRFAYAVQNRLPPRQAGPLLAARLIATTQRQQPQAQPQRSEFMATANPRGMVEPGNLPIWNRPIVRNADGSISSEYSISREDNGREVLVPTVVNGRFLTPDGQKPPEGSAAEKAMFDRAWEHYRQTGENLGKFDNPDNADAYAEQLHNRPMQGGR